MFPCKILVYCMCCSRNPARWLQTTDNLPRIALGRVAWIASLLLKTHDLQGSGNLGRMHDPMNVLVFAIDALKDTSHVANSQFC
jgi:hypothetical protein